MAQDMSANAQGTSTSYKGNSPAGQVMREAIELEIEERSPYPKRASFIDADTPYVGKASRRAVEPSSRRQRHGDRARGGGRQYLHTSRRARSQLRRPSTDLR
jgi:hypothetical protein